MQGNLLQTPAFTNNMFCSQLNAIIIAKLCYSAGLEPASLPNRGTASQLGYTTRRPDVRNTSLYYFSY